MSDEMDAMMADGLLHTVRECARHLYGENQIYPCDDVKRIVAENERLRVALREILKMEVYGFAITSPLGGDVVCEGTNRFARESDIIELRRIARAALEGKP